MMPKHGFKPDQGGLVLPSRLQKIMYSWWEQMWSEWLPIATKGEPFGIILNGDGVEGEPFHSTANISSNQADQVKIAVEVFTPLMALCDVRFKWIRGTEAHVGKSGCTEELAAQKLGAVPGQDGEFARFALWQKIGDKKVREPGLAHVLHHIGTTGSSAHESSAVNAELSGEFVEACKDGERPPDIVVRSHRHRWCEVRIGPIKIGNEYRFATATVTPGWQLKTPFAYRVAGGRITTPMFGAVLMRHGDRQVFTEPWVKKLKRDEPED